MTRYFLRWEPTGIVDQRRSLDPAVRQELDALLRRLVEAPFPGQADLGVLPLRDPDAAPSGDFYTAPFDSAFILYRVANTDYPLIRLAQITLLSDEEG